MPIARVQLTYKAVDNNPAVLTLATPSITTTTGNLLVVVTRTGQPPTASISSISDGTNTFTKISETNSQDPQISIWYAKNITGVTGAITATATAAFNFGWVLVIEYSGLDRTAPLDATASGSKAGAASTDLTSTAFSTATAGELIVMGGGQNNFATYTAGVDFSLIVGNIHDASGNYGGAEEYIPAGTLSAYTAHLTSGLSAQYTVAWAAFKAAPTLASAAPSLTLTGCGC